MDEFAAMKREIKSLRLDSWISNTISLLYHMRLLFYSGRLEETMCKAMVAMFSGNQEARNFSLT